MSKGWFISQFNAPGVTFEVGDTTPVDLVDKKGKVAAEGMMKILLKVERGESRIENGELKMEN